MPYVFCWPQFLKDYTNLTCFQTASHPGSKMFGFIFHLKYIILMFPFQINIYLQDMSLFFLIFVLCIQSQSALNSVILEMAMQNKDNKDHVSSRTPEISNYSFFSPLFLPFVYHCFLFWHNMWDMQTLKAAPRSFVWGTHHYPTPQPCMEWMFKNVWTMCIMYNNVLNIRSPLLHWDFCLYSPGLSGLIDLSWILH